MTQIDFYHLQQKTLEDVLPILLEKAYKLKQNILIKVGTEERVEFLNAHLWSFEESSFLPHGSKKDGFANLQPIWLTSGEDNPNQAKYLFLVDGAKISLENLTSFERVFNIFDGNNPQAVQEARQFWKDLKSASLNVNYWKQDENGKWIKAG